MPAKKYYGDFPPTSKSEVSQKMNKLLTAVVSIIVVLLALFVAAWIFIPIETVEGHELAVKETFTAGVVKDTAGQTAIFGPKKYLYIRALTTYIKYDMRKHHYILDAKENINEDAREDINGPALSIPAVGGQHVKARIDIVWRYDAKKLGTIHQVARNDRVIAETKILDNPVKRIAQELITQKPALESYYGEGLAKLQTAFHKELQADPSIAEAGLIIDSMVVYTDLEPDYVAQINAKVIAEQKKLAQEEIGKANKAEADAVKIQAEIEKNKITVAAEAQKQKAILEAEAAKQQQILAAEAEKEKMALRGAGSKAEKEAEAAGLKAMLLAQADGETALKLAMYDGVSGARRQQVELAKAVSANFKGLMDGKFVIPEKTFLQLTDVSGVKGIQPALVVNPEDAVEATNAAAPAKK